MVDDVVNSRIEGRERAAISRESEVEADRQVSAFSGLANKQVLTLIRTIVFTRIASSSPFYTVDIVLTRLHRTYVSSLTITRLAYTPYAHICTRIYVQIYGRACMRDFDAGVCACRVATGMFLSAGKCLSSCRCILIIADFFSFLPFVSLEIGGK